MLARAASPPFPPVAAPPHSPARLHLASSRDFTASHAPAPRSTPAGQLGAAPFDNSVFKVACNTAAGLPLGACEWNDKCTNPLLDETAKGCPFTAPVRAGFAACSKGATPTYPKPGLVSGTRAAHAAAGAATRAGACAIPTCGPA